MLNTIKASHLYFALIGSAASLGLLVVMPSNLRLASVSAVAGFGAGAVGVSELATRKVKSSQDDRLELERSQKLLKTYQDSLARVEADLSAAVQNLAVKAQDSEKCANEKRTLINQISELNEQLNAAKQLTAEYDLNIARATDTVNLYTNQFEFLLAVISRLQNDFYQRLGVLLDKHKALIKANFESEIESNRKIYAELAQEYDTALKKQENEMDILERELQALTVEKRTLLAQLQNITQPARLTAASRAANLANQVADWYLARNVQIDLRDAKEFKNTVQMWFTARNATKEIISKLNDDLYMYFELESEPEISLSDGSFKLVLETDPKPENVQKKLKMTDDDWLETIVDESAHWRIVGATKSGKSEFANNLVDFLRRRTPGLDVALINPLHYSPENKYSEFMKQNTVAKDYDESVDQLSFYADEVRSRLEINKQSVDSGKGNVQFSPLLLIVDEVDKIFAHDKSVAADWLEIAKTGRHIQIFLVMLGQNANVQATGLQIPDAQNFTNVAIGTTASVSIDKFIEETSVKSSLKKQVKKMMEETKYIAFVYTSSDTRKVVKLPVPNRYAVTVPPSYDPLDESEETEETGISLEQLQQQLEGLGTLDYDRPVPNLIPGLSYEETVKTLATGIKGNPNDVVTEIIAQIFGIRPNRGKDYQLLKEWYKTEKLRVKQILWG